MVQMQMIKTVNPANNKVLAIYDITSKESVAEIVNRSKNAFSEWAKDLNAHQRKEFLYAFSAELRKNKTALATVASEEMGKPIKESLSEVEKCAWVMEYFSDNGDILLSDESVNTDARKSIITFQPIGIIGSIMPWNFPYWQALRFAAPSLIVGNTIILKPASATTQCGLKIERTFNSIGLPEGVFQTITGNSSTAEHLIDSDINGVTFTGSITAGAKVAQRTTSQLKKCVLELGGSDAFIVCEDADIEKASEGAVKGRFINCGQSCIASKRFFVVKDVGREFIKKFIQKTEKLIVGDPLLESTDIGPLVNETALKNIDSLVEDAKEKGAQILVGGEPLENSKGFFYKPTVMTQVSKNMRIAQEETFGPVAPITVVEDETQAIDLANESEYGLGTSIWTKNLDKAERLSRAVQSGIVTVNNVVNSDPRVPFGGVKKSGFGRELSRYGMLEFVNIKSIRFYDQLIHEHHLE